MTVENRSAGKELVEKKCGSKKPLKSLGKGLFWVVTGGVLLLLTLAVVLFFVRDTVVVRTVTGAGSYLTGTAVTLESFESSLSGTIELKGLKVANPPGYHNKYALVLDRVYLHLVPGTLLSERIELKEISVSGIRIAYEPVLDGSNLQDIQRHLAEVSGGGSEKAGEEVSGPDAVDEKGEKAAEKQVVIRLLTVDDYAVTLASPAIKTSFTVPLPPVRMTDVGDGRTAAETLSLLYNEMLKSVFNALGSAGGAVASAVGDAARAAGSGLNSAGEAVVSSLDEAVRSAGNGAEEAGKQVVKSVSGIFGGLLSGKTESKSVEKPQKSEKNEKKSKNNLQKSK